jgi:hypothetical protein
MRNRHWLGVGIGVLGLLGMAAAPDARDETVFTYVSAMPTVEGELEEAREGLDSRSGLAIRKRIYLAETDGFALRTHVIEAACAALPEPTEPHMVALQYFPKAPKSFTVAAMPDLFMEVYVRDEDGRIRVYEQVAGGAMADLTSRFEPACRPL